MTDAAKPTNPIAPGNELRLTGPHWTFITKLYGNHEVEHACLHLQDRFGVDVSFLLTLLCYARNGVEFDEGDVEALDRTIVSWRSDVVKPLRKIRREIKLTAMHDGGVAGFRNEIRLIEVEAEQIEIAILTQAADHHGRIGVSGSAARRELIRRTVETVFAFYADRAAAPTTLWQSPETYAAINALADATARAPIADFAD